LLVCFAPPSQIGMLRAEAVKACPLSIHTSMWSTDTAQNTFGVNKRRGPLLPTNKTNKKRESLHLPHSSGSGNEMLASSAAEENYLAQRLVQRLMVI
jgi:hypothetical protein